MRNYKVFLEFLKDNVLIFCLNFIITMDFFRVMFLILLLCKMVFLCISFYVNIESYLVMLLYLIKKMVLEFDGCSFFGLMIKKDKVLRYFYLYKNVYILGNFNNMFRS